MKTLSLSEVKMKLSQFVEEVNETDNPISITRNGEAVAALISQELFQGYLDTINIMRDVQFYQAVLTNMKLLERGEGISLTIDELFKERIKSDEKASSVRIKVLPDVRDKLIELHPEIQTKLYGFFQKIFDKEESGILLKDTLDGLAKFSAGEYGIIYRWRMRTIEIINVDLRTTAYRETVSV